MDAIEGRGVLGGFSEVPGGETAGKRRVRKVLARRRHESGGDDGLERLLDRIRYDLDAVVNEKSVAYEGVRSEVALRRVLARVQAGRQRGAWMMRTSRAILGVWMSLWNSRAVRMLVP